MDGEVRAALAEDPLRLLSSDALDCVVAHLPIEDAASLLRCAAYLAFPVARRVAAAYGLNTRQTDAVVRFLLGQSFFLTGEGGVGKSFVLHALIDVARSLHGEDGVAVVASTSSAANQLIGVSAPVQTLHAFLDAREVCDAGGEKRWVLRPKKQLIRLRALFVDEVSMTTDDHYDCLVASVHRSCQIVATGDLLQLPPCGRPGAFPFVFKSASFRRLRAVELVRNVRARGGESGGPMFRSILRRIRFGAATDEDELWLRTHSRSEPVNDFALFTKRRRCDDLNERCFSRLTAPMHAIVATDEVETVKWAWAAADGALVKDTRYYNRATMHEAQASIGLSGRAGQVQDALTPKEYAALRPPGEARHSVCLRAGMQVVLTRAIWWGPQQEPGEGGGLPRRSLEAANGEVGRVVAISDDGASVEFPPRDGGAPRLVRVGKVRYRRACSMCARTLLQRVWVRSQVPLEIGYARTAHKAQGTTLARPTHLDCSDVWYGSKGSPPFVFPSIIYVLIGRAQSVSQLHFSRDKRGLVFDVRNARPDPAALAYHCDKVGRYSPLQSVVDACGGDDVRD